MGSLKLLYVLPLLGFMACSAGEPRVAKPTAQDAGEAVNVNALVQDALEAHGKGEMERFLRLSLEAEALLPEHPRLVYNSACGYALTGQVDAALDHLEGLARMQAFFDLEADEDLSSLRESDHFAELVDTMAELSTAIERSSVAFSVPDRTFLVEGVALDPGTGDLLLSSLYQRRIARVTPDQDLIELTRPGGDLWSMLGMVIAPGGESLWTVTVAGPRMQGGSPDRPLESALVRISLADGAELERYAPPAGLERSALDSVAVARDGTVYVSDSGAGAIHRHTPGSTGLELFVPAGSFHSTQGLELSADERILYAADYSRGLAAVDTVTGEARFLPFDGPSLVGIDGLERHGKDLIAIQNGIRPNRVVRIRLSDDGLGIVAIETLERAHHLYKDPTLGTVVGDELLYVASSQWRSFDQQGKLLVDELVPATILRLPLEP